VKGLCRPSIDKNAFVLGASINRGYSLGLVAECCGRPGNDITAWWQLLVSWSIERQAQPESA